VVLEDVHISIKKISEEKFNEGIAKRVKGGKMR
jgi:hypothetical protein